MHLHDSYVLYTTKDAYTLVGQSEKAETLTISRGANSFSIKPGANPPPRPEQELVVYGLFGVISLLKSDYLIVITKRTKVATVFTSPIYSANDFSVFPLERSSSAELVKHPQEAYLLGLIKSHLYSAPFYFTYGGYNVTSRLQEQEPSEKPLWETADDRFFWNRHLQRRFIDAMTSAGQEDYSRFILPCIFGFLEFKHASINGRNFLFGLISRRNRYRAGTRYFSRGIDQAGNVSNFNETEQIVLLDAQNGGGAAGSSGGAVRGDIRFSYVQTRGSVPVYWAEINNLRYKPDLKILDLSSTAESLSRHFDQQISLYGDQYLVNLVNSHGYEKPVKDAYERALNAMGNPRIHYTYFDFHKECKGLRFDRVSVLIDSLDQDLQQQGYFFHDTTAAKQPQRKQISVVRTNCMDCLDRTNVVQSALAKWVLNNQLRQIGVLSVKESVEEHAAFLNLFRNVWADNADVVSRAYSGTGALKTDYTRTGKRSKEGALQDGINSAIRYIKNNFLDGPRQDAYDLVTGTWVPRKGEELGWADKRELAVRAAPWILLFGLFALFVTFFAAAFVNDYVASSRKVAIVSLALVAFAFNSILVNGIDYVSQPRLARQALDDILGYTGKGYESGRRGRPVKKKLVSVESSAKNRQARKESLLPSLSSPQIKQE
ncbi:Phosphatidylinositol-3-phosphatase SAC1 [Rhodotorula toruloides]|uniref:BY PROTMAP: gi/472580420/gb/EMS18224.1/ inositol/phosphatidylinositol phosphatase [Rhodosporidium toruloides NP11] gi/647403672/emb/CDR49756.1/ RHTO0S32e00188g1_1 [Rhodosporidium toruloides] n=1 Tax=Rhodotorula toruloides TaxID=5286 RepID=A0A0K3CND0_RHOTO|nr:Phosphatidylinositol-3-phosphatase SAC1 [Rhodotorula toruloides]PRQ70149.1 SacI homology domain-domain containing protein [Rhodotorula toruloides]